MIALVNVHDGIEPVQAFVNHLEPWAREAEWPLWVNVLTQRTASTVTPRAGDDRANELRVAVRKAQHVVLVLTPSLLSSSELHDVLLPELSALPEKAVWLLHAKQCLWSRIEALGALPLLAGYAGLGPHGDETLHTLMVAAANLIDSCREELERKEDYRYDVYVSYSRYGLDRAVAQWLKEHFVPRLEEWLPSSLGRPPRIYIDYEPRERAAGTLFQRRRALLASRCLLSIWSGTYFNSPLCCAELKSMLRREQQLTTDLQPPPDERARPLVYRVAFHDGQSFPERLEHLKIRDHHDRDLRDWASTSPTFKESRRYNDFERAMQELAYSVASLIDRAPPWSRDWPLQGIEQAAGQPVALRRPAW